MIQSVHRLADYTLNDMINVYIRCGRGGTIITRPLEKHLKLEWSLQRRLAEMWQKKAELGEDNALDISLVL